MDLIFYLSFPELNPLSWLEYVNFSFVEPPILSPGMSDEANKTPQLQMWAHD